MAFRIVEEREQMDSIMYWVANFKEKVFEFLGAGC